LSAPHIAHRLHQIALALRRRSAPPVDPSLFPSHAAWLLFRDLHVHDQRHLVEVYRKARAAGLDDDLCAAALLHDIGKVTLTGTRISLPARIAHVLLGRLAPPMRGSPMLERVPWLGVGLRLAERHAGYGAERLRAVGVADSICGIVASHDVEPHPDERVRRLQEIDSTTP
jgi:hypothetical protein